MDEFKWYKSDRVWLAITLVAIVVSMSLVYQQSLKDGQEKTVVPAIGDGTRLSEGFQFPKRDISGARDFEDIGRPPKSKIIWQQKSKISGLDSKTVKYISRSTPKQAQLYFTNMLLNDYYIVRDDLLTNDGHGWVGIFRKKDNDDILAIFTTSKLIGSNPGSPNNPTEISIMKIGK